ncbi:MAG: flap endonuclease [Clostridia bacterium]|nr:flap endonuclease [Clostridia bacterium]
MNRILVVDGSNLLFQMFFGMPARITNSKGKAIHGVLGFVGALLKIIRQTDPSHITVVFDGEHYNARTEINKDYKANRVDYSTLPEDESPFSQIDYVFSALDVLGIKYTEATICEADDIISGYALKYGTENEVIVCSFDSDFFQLITDSVSVLRYRGERSVICTPSYIKEKLGIQPSQYVCFKSLTGDTADNIKGAPHIGAKTAAQLLSCFDTLEDVIAGAENIKKPSVRRSVMENSARLRDNYKLIKLGLASDLPFSLDELKYNYNGITTNEVLNAIDLLP